MTVHKKRHENPSCSFWETSHWSTTCWWYWRKSPGQKAHPLINVNPIYSSVLNLVSVKNYPNYHCSLLTPDCATTFSVCLSMKAIMQALFNYFLRSARFGKEPGFYIQNVCLNSLGINFKWNVSISVLGNRYNEYMNGLFSLRTKWSKGWNEVVKEQHPAQGCQLSTFA